MLHASYKKFVTRQPDQLIPSSPEELKMMAEKLRIKSRSSYVSIMYQNQEVKLYEILGYKDGILVYYHDHEKMVVATCYKDKESGRLFFLLNNKGDNKVYLPSIPLIKKTH